jgi:dihydrolipoamide dehydrogenase
LGASGCILAGGYDEGFPTLLFYVETGRGAIVGTNAGDTIGEIALAI